MEQLANNALTQLDGAINNSTTSLTVDTGSVLPSSGNFRLKVEDELMLVTLRSTNVLTVTRGIEGTTAVSHADNTVVEHIFTKGSIEQLLAEAYQVGAYGSRPSSHRAGSIYQATDATYSWRSDGTNWDLIAPNYVPYTSRFSAQSWTNQNHSTQLTTSNLNEILKTIVQGTGGTEWRGWTKAVPSAPYTVTLLVEEPPYSAGTHFGLGIRNSSGGQFKHIFAYANSADPGFSVEEWSSNTGFNAQYVGLRRYRNRTTYLRLVNDNTNISYQASVNGAVWDEIYIHAKNTYITPDQIYVTVMNTQSSTLYAKPSILGYWEV